MEYGGQWSIKVHLTNRSLGPFHYGTLSIKHSKGMLHCIGENRKETLCARAWIVDFLCNCIWSTALTQLYSVNEWVTVSDFHSALPPMMSASWWWNWATRMVLITPTTIWPPPLMWKARNSFRHRVKIWKSFWVTASFSLGSVGTRDAITSKNCEIFSKDHCVEYPR